jgi:hypothetical protein
MSPYKEPYYFAPDLSAPTSHHLRFRKKENYLKLFAKAKDEEYLGEASVYYLYSKVAAKNILEFNPNSKIIIILRSPVELINSLYSSNYHSGNEILTLNKALEAEEDRKRGKKLPPKSNFIYEGYYYTEVVKFYEQVKRYLNTFPKENVHIILFRDFINNVSKTYKDVLNFLGVNDNFNATFRQYNPSRKPKNAKIQSLINSYIINPLQNTDLLALIPETIINKVKDFSRTSKNVNYVDEQTKRKTINTLKNDMDKLSGLIDRDLSYWYK